MSFYYVAQIQHGPAQIKTDMTQGVSQSVQNGIGAGLGFLALLGFVVLVRHALGLGR